MLVSSYPSGMNSPIQPLLTEQGRAFLAQWQADQAHTLLSPLEQSAELRRLGATPELAAAILTQCELRERARGKFGSLADDMLLTRDGYEQATRRIVAQRRAQRFAQAGARCVADLGCGNGGDAMAFSATGLGVMAVDIDEDAAACARWNLQIAADSSPSQNVTTQVLIADVTTLNVPGLRQQGVDAIFADPARRTGHARGASRVLSPDKWSPSLPTVLSWRSDYDLLGVKVAPGIDYEAIPADFLAEWVSVDGDLVEAALYSPALAPKGSGRQATVIRGEQVFTLRDEASANSPALQAELVPVGSFIAEPDGAVIRAGLLARVAGECGMGIISPGIAYMSGDCVPDSPFVQTFEVLDVVALKPKAIAAVLRGLNAHSVEVKKRGADIDPASLRASVKKALQSKSADTREITVIASRVNGKHQAILAQRLIH